MNTDDVGSPTAVAQAVAHMLRCGERAVFIRPALLLAALPPFTIPSAANLALRDPTAFTSGSSSDGTEGLLGGGAADALAQVLGPLMTALTAAPAQRAATGAASSRGARRGSRKAPASAAPVLCLTSTDALTTCIPLACGVLQRALGRGVEHMLAAAAARDGLLMLDAAASPLLTFSLGVGVADGRAHVECAMLPTAPSDWTQCGMLREFVLAPPSALDEMLGARPAAWVATLRGAALAAARDAEPDSTGNNVAAAPGTAARWAAFVGTLRRVVADPEADVRSCCRTLVAMMAALHVRLIDDGFLRPATSHDAEGLDVLAELTTRADAESARRSGSAAGGGGAGEAVATPGEAGLMFLERLSTAVADEGGTAETSRPSRRRRRIASLPHELHRFVCEWLLECTNQRLAAINVALSASPLPLPLIVACCVHTNRDVLPGGSGDRSGSGPRSSGLLAQGRRRGGHDAATAAAAGTPEARHPLDMHFFSKQLAPSHPGDSGAPEAAALRSKSRGSGDDAGVEADDLAARGPHTKRGVSMRHLLGNIAAEMVFASCGEALGVRSVATRCGAIPLLARDAHARVVALQLLDPTAAPAGAAPADHPCSVAALERQYLARSTIDEQRLLHLRGEADNRPLPDGSRLAADALVRVRHGFGDVWYSCDAPAVPSPPARADGSGGSDDGDEGGSAFGGRGSRSRRRGGGGGSGTPANALLACFQGDVLAAGQALGAAAAATSPSPSGQQVRERTGTADVDRAALEELRRMFGLAARHVGDVLRPLIERREGGARVVFTHIVPSPARAGDPLDPMCATRSAAVSVVGHVLAADAAPRFVHRTTFAAFVRHYFALLSPAAVDRLRARQEDEGLTDTEFVAALCGVLGLPRGSFTVEQTAVADIGGDEGGGTVQLTAAAVAQLRRALDAADAESNAAAAAAAHRAPPPAPPPTQAPARAVQRCATATPTRKRSKGGTRPVPSSSADAPSEATPPCTQARPRAQSPRSGAPRAGPLSAVVHLNRVAQQRIARSAAAQQRQAASATKAQALREHALGPAKAAAWESPGQTPRLRTCEDSAVLVMSPGPTTSTTPRQSRACLRSPKAAGRGAPAPPSFGFGAWQQMLHEIAMPPPISATPH